MRAVVLEEFKSAPPGQLVLVHGGAGGWAMWPCSSEAAAYVRVAGDADLAWVSPRSAAEGRVHLYRIFPKLGITFRAALGSALPRDAS